jgi:F420-dependent oxidoreductase-like protein
VRFSKPLSRTREYVEIVRMALARQRLEYAGEHFTLPLPDGPGKALKLTIAPTQEHLPVYLAAVGPKNLELAGEIADGWLAIFFSPEHSGDIVGSIAAGRRAAGRGTDANPLEGFDIVPTVPVVVTDDLEAGAAAVAAYSALYIGGMGSKEKNFYNQLACRMGFEQEAARVQELFLAGQHRDAAQAVPFEFIDATALIGSPERIGQRLGRYADAGVTTLGVSPFAMSIEERLDTLRVMSELVPSTTEEAPTT